MSQENTSVSDNELNQVEFYKLLSPNINLQVKLHGSNLPSLQKNIYQN